MSNITEFIWNKVVGGEADRLVFIALEVEDVVDWASVGGLPVVNLERQERHESGCHSCNMARTCMVA